MGIDGYPYTTKEIKRMKFFRYGFYISLAVWMCGICFTMFSEVSVIMKLIIIAVTLGIYLFFVVGKAIMEADFVRKSNGNV